MDALTVKLVNNNISVPIAEMPVETPHDGGPYISIEFYGRRHLLELTPEDMWALRKILIEAGKHPAFRKPRREK